MHQKSKLTTEVNGKRTICEVHREIWDIIDAEIQDKALTERLFEKLEESYFMAKKMDGKLRQYKFNYDNDWWEKEKPNILKAKKELRRQRNK